MQVDLKPLPITDPIVRVEYRIAYICLCIENSDLDRGLLEALNEITAIDPENIQLHLTASYSAGAS